MKKFKKYQMAIVLAVIAMFSLLSGVMTYSLVHAAQPTVDLQTATPVLKRHHLTLSRNYSNRQLQGLFAHTFI